MQQLVDFQYSRMSYKIDGILYVNLSLYIIVKFSIHNII